MATEVPARAITGMSVRTPTRIMISFRVPPEALAEIDLRAGERKMSRTEYMIRASLGELDTVQSLEDRERFERIEDRLTRAEDALFGEA